MAQADMGLGVVPEGVFNLFGRSMDLVAVPLADAWARRELRLVTRNATLSPAAELLVRHLTARPHASAANPES
jgi:DNA-binding transcriptional LysR family regulator